MLTRTVFSLREGWLFFFFYIFFFLKEIKNTKTKKFSSSFPSKHCGIFRSGYLKARADHNFRQTQCAFEILFHIKLNLSWTDFLEVFFIRNNSPQLKDHRIRYHRKGNRNRNKASSSASSRELPTDCFGGRCWGGTILSLGLSPGLGGPQFISIMKPLFLC